MIIPGIIASSGGGGSYTGPLDLVPGALVAYSPARALSAAWIGQNVVKLRRDSDDATMDFVAGADGYVDTAAVATWLNGANGFIDTLYDQSGNGDDMVQATAGRQPAWTPDVANSHPAMTFTAANSDLLATAGAVTFANPGITVFNVMAPVEAIAANVNDQIAGAGWATSSGGFQQYWSQAVPPDSPLGSFVINYLDDADGVGPFYYNTTLAEYNDGATHIWDIALDGANSPYSGTLAVDGEAFANEAGPGDPGFSGLEWPLALGNNDSTRGVGAGSYFDGTISEYIIYPSSLSDPNRALVRGNQAAAYGITLA